MILIFLLFEFYIYCNLLLILINLLVIKLFSFHIVINVIIIIFYKIQFYFLINYGKIRIRILNNHNFINVLLK